MLLSRYQLPTITIQFHFNFNYEELCFSFTFIAKVSAMSSLKIIYDDFLLCYRKQNFSSSFVDSYMQL